LWLWNRTKKDFPIEGVSAAYCREIKKHVTIPVLNTGGYQRGSLIRQVIADGWCDGVDILASGQDLPERPCSFCNRCLINAAGNPLACYDQRRFASYEAMVEAAMAVFDPPPYPAKPVTNG
jgi:2,4-dienoyl-CoA reductase (NADPH2)